MHIINFNVDGQNPANDIMEICEKHKGCIGCPLAGGVPYQTGEITTICETGKSKRR